MAQVFARFSQEDNTVYQEPFWSQNIALTRSYDLKIKILQKKI